MVTTVYRYFDKNGRLLYVGITGNQSGRIEDHAKNRAWWKDVDHGTFVHYETRQQALDKEFDAIAEELPVHNKAGATISENAYAHLVDVLQQKFTDTWHRDLLAKYDDIRKDVFNFSSTPAAYQVVFSLDACLEWDEDGMRRMVSCQACQEIVDSKWFQYIYPLANDLICDEAVTR